MIRGEVRETMTNKGPMPKTFKAMQLISINLMPKLEANKSINMSVQLGVGFLWNLMGNTLKYFCDQDDSMPSKISRT